MPSREVLHGFLPRKDNSFSYPNVFVEEHLNHLLHFTVASPLHDLPPSRARPTSDRRQREQLEHRIAQTETDRKNLSAQDADLSLARSDDISAKLMLRFVRM
jgi:hypothetical protein